MLEANDLKHILSTTFSVDEFRAKMGEDADICVVAFECTSETGALDTCNFIEKGYDFVLDADASTGTEEDGIYRVYVEFERTEDLPKQLCEMVSDLGRLTDTNIEDWKFKFYRNVAKHEVNEKVIAEVVPCCAEDYLSLRAERMTEDDEFSRFRMLIGLPVRSNNKKVDEEIAWLLTAAGIK